MDTANHYAGQFEVFSKKKELTLNSKSVVTQVKAIAKVIIGLGLLLVLIFSIADFRGSPTILPDQSDAHLKAYYRGSLTGAQASIFSYSCGQEIPISETSNLDDYGSMNNPAAVYCGQLGYRYEIVTSSDGSQHGICELPDEVTCDAWGFLTGKCGQDYSVCAQQGLQTVTLTDGKNPYSVEYAVCVDTEGNHLGSATDMIEPYQAPENDTLQEHNPLSKAEKPPENVYTAPPDAAPSASLDWRTGGWMSPVKDQGGCGSCWSFSAVGVTEAVHNIASNNPNLDLDLSEQYLVSDCFMLWGYQTCCGGHKDKALEYIRDTGVPDENCMTYVDGNFSSGCGCDGGTCGAPNTCTYNSSGVCSDQACSDRCGDWASRLTKISSTGSVSTDQTSIKQALIDHGPLAVSYGVGTAYGGAFDGDVYKCTSDTGTNHAVTMVGYNDAGSYWIIKNSWGSSFQDGGYMKIGYGECYIEERVYYADAASSCYSLNTTVSPSGGGSITANPTPNCGGTQYNPGTIVQLTAAPVAGYSFLSWSGHASGSTNPINVTMDGNKSVTANFDLIGGHKIYLPLVLKNYSSSPPSSSIPNGDFELGYGVHWQEYSSNNYELVVQSPITRSGSWAAWLGGDNDEISRLYQPVTIPTDNHFLSFWYQIYSDDACGYDYAYIKINDTDSWQADLCTSTSTSDWTQGSIDLTAYAGQSVTLEFRAETDSSLNSNLFIDDVSFAASALLHNEPASNPSPLAESSAASLSKQDVWGPR